MPAVPGPEIGIAREFSVRKAYRRRTLISSIREMNAGSRWPIVGRAIACRTRSGTSEGPGPIRVRRGGSKLFIAMEVYGERSDWLSPSKMRPGGAGAKRRPGYRRIGVDSGGCQLPVASHIGAASPTALEGVLRRTGNR